MSAYSKAIGSVIASVITMLATFGVDVPENIQGILVAFASMLGPVLVYFLPNKTA